MNERERKANDKIAIGSHDFVKRLIIKIDTAKIELAKSSQRQSFQRLMIVRTFPIYKNNEQFWW